MTDIHPEQPTKQFANLILSWAAGGLSQPENEFEKIKTAGSSKPLSQKHDCLYVCLPHKLTHGTIGWFEEMAVFGSKLTQSLALKNKVILVTY